MRLPRRASPRCSRTEARGPVLTIQRGPSGFTIETVIAVFLGEFDPRQIHPRLPAPGRRVAAPAQAGAGGFPDLCAGGEPLACGLAPFGNRTRQTSTGRLLSGPLAQNPTFPPHISPRQYSTARNSTPTANRLKAMELTIPASIARRLALRSTPVRNRTQAS